MSIVNNINQISKKLNDYIDSDDKEKLSLVGELVAKLNLKLINKYLDNKSAKLLKSNNFPDNLTKTEIVPGVTVRAYIIQSPSQAHNHRGFWCYYPEEDRYYLSINNKLIYSYITKINNYNDKPVKFLEYDDRKQTSNYNLFYCPPELYGGTDKRQLTEKMIFVSKNNEIKKNQKYIYRIGDKDTLAEDLSLSTNSELRLVRDISAHWIMIGYLSSKQNFIRNRC